MKKSFYKFLVFAPIVSLCACGYKVKEVFNFNDYNNEGSFDLNYYRVYSEEIKPGSSNIRDLGEYVLDDAKDYVFKSYEDNNFKFVEPNSDKYEYQDEGLQSDGKGAYGSKNKLSLSDETFKQGYVSKLFDGQMFCNGKFEKARVQIDENGFGSLFQKEISSYSYFAMNFKAAYNFKLPQYKISSSGSKSVITLNIGFYVKNSDNTIGLKTVKYHFDNVPTNTGDSHSASSYVFFGFKFSEELNIERCCGLSVSYQLESGSVVNITDNGVYTADQAKTMGINHCLLLYEVFLPNSTWR